MLSSMDGLGKTSSTPSCIDGTPVAPASVMKEVKYTLEVIDPAFLPGKQWVSTTKASLTVEATRAWAVLVEGLINKWDLLGWVEFYDLTLCRKCTVCSSMFIYVGGLTRVRHWTVTVFCHCALLVLYCLFRNFTSLWLSLFLFMNSRTLWLLTLHDCEVNS